jgi:hypothetical protein
VWELQSGEWVWTVWSQGQSGSGIAPTEAEAQQAAERELERIVADEAAADRGRREVRPAGARPTDWDPQS